MRTEEIKADRELEVFSEFVAVSNLPFNLRTTEKRIPPQPDILSTHPEDGLVAFELVEICDSNLAEFFSTVKEGGAYYMRTGDPSAQIITKKLRKRYKTEHPIELLCYTDGRVITPADVVIPTIRPYLRSFEHVFRRAWLLSRHHVYALWPAG